MKDKKLVLVFMDSLQGVNFHRIQTPFLRLLEQDYPIHFFGNFNDLKEFNTDFVSHIVVSRRCTVNNYQSFKEWLKNNDIKLVLDLDDYWELPKHFESYVQYSQRTTLEIIQTMMIADIIWTPSKYLAKLMSRENTKAKIEVIPNTINLDHEQWKQRKKPSKEVRFGYVGAKNHSKDLNEMAYDFSKKESYSVDLDDYALKLRAKYILAPHPIGWYGKLYEYFDVSLSPIQGGKFNKSKSDLKVVEAGFTRTSIIASNKTPYKESIQNNVTGLLCSSARDWKNAIESMTKEKHRELSGNLHRYVKKHYDLDKINSIRTKSLGL